MTASQIFRLLHLVSYLIITSQVLFYLIVYSDALRTISVENFIRHRKSVEQLIASRLRIAYYGCLLISAVMVVIAFKNNDGITMLTTSVALICLIADVLIAVKGSIPINQFINNTPFDTARPEWDNVRKNWLKFITLRGYFTVAGMISLLLGLVLNS